MKINELNAEELCNYLAEITPFVLQIMEDEKITGQIFDNSITEVTNEQEVTKIFMKRIFIILPVLLKEHREAIFNIIAISYNMTLDEVKAQNGFALIKQVKDLFAQNIGDYFL